MNIILLYIKSIVLLIYKVIYAACIFFRKVVSSNIFLCCLHPKGNIQLQ